MNGSRGEKLQEDIEGKEVFWDGFHSMLHHLGLSRKQPLPTTPAGAGGAKQKTWGEGEALFRSLQNAWEARKISAFIKECARKHVGQLNGYDSGPITIDWKVRGAFLLSRQGTKKKRNGRRARIKPNNQKGQRP